MGGTKRSGYQGKIEVSVDGMSTWVEIDGITSGEFPFEAQTQDVTTWQDNGETRTETILVSASLSLEGFRQEGDPGQELLKSTFFASESVRAKAHFRFYLNKTVTTSYWQFEGNLASFSESSPVAERQTFSAEINATQLLPVGVFAEV